MKVGTGLRKPKEREQYPLPRSPSTSTHQAGVGSCSHASPPALPELVERTIIIPGESGGAMRAVEQSCGLG